MDARITKQRLSNLISYDWLKMLVTILVFVLVLVLLFTMTATRPRKDQEFAIYAHTDLQTDRAFSSLGDTLEEKKVFSYDILSVTTEGFSGNNYASATFTARRAAGQGTVMFMTDNPTYKKDENGNDVLDENGERVIETQSELYQFAAGAIDENSITLGAVYDTEYYFSLCEDYLVQFFGDDWTTSDTLDGVRTIEESFARNEKDKRYRSDESKVQGLEDERERVLQLREDYIAVQKAFDEGKLSHTVYEFEEDGKTYEKSLGINVGGLNLLKNLVYYTDSAGARTTKNVNLVIFYNNYLDGADLCFETVSLLRYLVETYQ